MQKLKLDDFCNFLNSLVIVYDITTNLVSVIRFHLVDEVTDVGSGCSLPVMVGTFQKLYTSNRDHIFLYLFKSKNLF